FFSSRRRHTRSKRDWSSDVCSSDLAGRAESIFIKSINAVYPAHHEYDESRYERNQLRKTKTSTTQHKPIRFSFPGVKHMNGSSRSEERRVGKKSGYRRVANCCRDSR